MSETFEYTFPCVRANYDNPPLGKSYARNPLTCALGAIPDEEQLRRALTVLPTFDPQERNLNKSQRRLKLETLKRLMVGLPRVAELAEHTNACVLESLLGREPFTPESNRFLQEMYDLRTRTRRGEVDLFRSFGQVRNTAQFTIGLIGTPGGGKSFSLAHIASLYPPCIHHPKLGIWQIPMLQIEMPTSGSSINTLAHAILLELHERFPEGRYFELYLKPKGNAEQRFLTAMALMRTHCVGALVVDEAQNHPERVDASSALMSMLRKPTTAWSGRSPLTRLLIMASNKSQIPLILAGTAELRQLLGTRLSGLRRIHGLGMRTWGPLEVAKRSNERKCEFDMVLNAVWRYQWVHHYSRTMPDGFRSHMHFYTYGIPDLVVKLFQSTQWRAIRTGSERITTDLLDKVAFEEYGELVAVTAAMRERDAKAMELMRSMSDIAAEFGLDQTAVNANSSAMASAKKRAAAALKKLQDEVTAESELPTAEKLTVDDLTEDERHELINELRKRRAARAKANASAARTFQADQIVESTLDDLEGS